MAMMPKEDLQNSRLRRDHQEIRRGPCRKPRKKVSFRACFLARNFAWGADSPTEGFAGSERRSEGAKLLFGDGQVTRSGGAPTKGVWGRVSSFVGGKPCMGRIKKNPREILWQDADAARGRADLIDVDCMQISLVKMRNIWSVATFT